MLLLIFESESKFEKHNKRANVFHIVTRLHFKNLIKISQGFAH